MIITYTALLTGIKFGCVKISLSVYIGLHTIWPQSEFKKRETVCWGSGDTSS